ncbi:tRNA preQ1(34) S-adenosylmethionine ribosyltransferase-isomerase QueA [Magnetospira sp. QH-2]|uniref:tRNA preQ1(34) S-adenosylmethionine ribosyltransferase-isomerase QueA n=1 Tax=Magnetospira sp. (strain QH-2) TaxID=1288970 RepID=UPI0003E8186E|nr:tRNA preQ1(34) S-adenosylmethionine ribosyltransferase-isomerase QueA [Magnetospira sp. QH-2]CCQ75263.1 S-adenosylmethionine:tRNA ribosyltransferase-isomerase [Magnetospira sp. QH-2]
MDVDLFDFELPRELIAQRPAVPRDSARLLHVGAMLADRGMTDLVEQLRPGDLLLSNDTRVIPARLAGKRGEAKVEVTLHKQAGPDAWHAFARPARKLRPGDELRFNDRFAAQVTEKGDMGEVLLTFDRSGGDLIAALEQWGIMPLPPYIRQGHGDARDRDDYQTLFAARDGAVAAPTAGLHFTPDLLRKLDDRGVKNQRLTLHVGAGTFLPVKVERVEEHKMHAEWGEISEEVAAAVNHTRAQGGRIVAVGTTSLRLLESAVDDQGIVQPFQGETDIFIYPGFQFRAVDLLMTNFHLPRSTLFMLVCAFAGTERMKAAYAHAVAQQYRFYSYGDGCLLERGES